MDKEPWRKTLSYNCSTDLDPNSPSAAKEWKHWHRTFRNFIDECAENAPNKFRTLVNYVSHNVYDYIEDGAYYDAAIETLTQLYIKTPNEISARHLLATRRQKPGETEFLQELRKLSKDCNLKMFTAEQYREELVRDSFINGIASPLIQQRLLENTRSTWPQDGLWSNKLLRFGTEEFWSIRHAKHSCNCSGIKFSNIWAYWNPNAEGSLSCCNICA